MSQYCQLTVNRAMISKTGQTSQCDIWRNVYGISTVYTELSEGALDGTRHIGVMERVDYLGTRHCYDIQG